MQYQENNTTNSTGHKLPTPGKEYLSSKIEGVSTHASQCAKPRELTKVIDLNIYIE